MGGIVNSSGQITSSSQAGFFAYRNTTTQSITGGTVLIFDSTFYNSGGYSTSTGLFTAPTTGIYLLSWWLDITGLSTSNNHTFGADLIFSDGSVLRSYATRFSTISGLVATVAYPMTSGMTVKLQCFLDTATTVSLFGQSGNVRNSCFSGLLIG